MSRVNRKKEGKKKKGTIVKKILKGPKFSNKGTGYKKRQQYYSGKGKHYGKRSWEK